MTTTPLQASYATCRALHRRHGTTYYLAARLLPPGKRAHVHALYGFCRYADEIVDSMGPAPMTARADTLGRLSERFAADLAAGHSDHSVLAALVDTVITLGIDREAIDRFLRSMMTDLSVTRYQTWDELCVYMDGSAAVIGEMMLPVLEPLDSARALGPARDLGIAFQLTNFLRDVGEDLERGRVYLPAEDLDRFGADPWPRQVTPGWVALMGFEIERARTLYESADRGIDLLPPRSGACVRTALVLYRGILDRIEANGYDVFSTRARVPAPRKVATALRCLAGTIGTRNP